LQVRAVGLDPGIKQEEAGGGNGVGSQAKASKLLLEVESLRRRPILLDPQAQRHQYP
jgi:hypothetical protein